MKICRKCNIEKELSLYPKDKVCKDGISNICKECHNLKNKKYHDENKDEIRDKRKEFYNENKDIILQRKKERYHAKKQTVDTSILLNE